MLELFPINNASTGLTLADCSRCTRGVFSRSSLGSVQEMAHRGNMLIGGFSHVDGDYGVLNVVNDENCFITYLVGGFTGVVTLFCISFSLGVSALVIEVRSKIRLITQIAHALRPSVSTYICHDKRERKKKKKKTTVNAISTTQGN